MCLANLGEPMIGYFENVNAECNFRLFYWEQLFGKFWHHVILFLFIKNYRTVSCAPPILVFVSKKELFEPVCRLLSEPKFLKLDRRNQKATKSSSRNFFLAACWSKSQNTLLLHHQKNILILFFFELEFVSNVFFFLPLSFSWTKKQSWLVDWE